MSEITQQNTKSKSRLFSPILLGFSAGFTLNAALVLLTLFVNESSQAARCATSLVMPLGLVWSAMLVASIVMYLSGEMRYAAFFVTIFLFISITGNDWIANALMDSVEAPRTDTHLEGEPLRAAVLMGGGTMLARDRQPQLGSSGDRAFTAAQLWHSGRAKSIICTGTSPTDDLGPGQTGRLLLASVGVPQSKLFLLEGRNTSQEMRHLAAFLDHPPPDFPSSGRLGVVTSAYHIKRVLRLSKANGLDLVPIPSDYRTAAAGHFTPHHFVPQSDALENTSIALKEWLARVVGR